MTQRLTAEIETAVGRPMRTRRDFDILSQLIFTRLHEQVSASTLKRMWGYYPAVAPHVSTLTILARFLGYRDWDAYCNGEGRTAPSSPVLGRWLDVDRDLSAGERVRLTWAPGRVCEVAYHGDRRFVVESAVATRLLPGDTFECMVMLEDQPLYLHNLLHAGQREPMAYVCGLQSGVRFEVLNTTPGESTTD